MKQHLIKTDIYYNGYCGCYGLVLTLNESLYEWEITSSDRYLKSSWGSKLLVDTPSPKLQIVENATISQDVETDYIIVNITESSEIANYSLGEVSSGDKIDPKVVDFAVSSNLIYIFVDYDTYIQYNKELITLLFFVEDEAGNNASILLFINLDTNNSENIIPSIRITAPLESSTELSEQYFDFTSLYEWLIAIAIVMIIGISPIMIRRLILKNKN